MNGTWFARFGRPSAGRVLALASLLPALGVAGWLLAGFPLLLLGWFRPLPVVLLAVVAIAALCRYGLRRLPETVSATAGQTAALCAVAAGATVFNGLLHSEQLIVRRDPATYAQYVAWLAGGGPVPAPLDHAPFGGPDPALFFDSLGFYQYQGTILPQFMAGLPIILSLGMWLGGLAGMLLMPPLLGGLAVLTFGGTVARLLGARWAAPAALVLAVSLPFLYTSRTTFSEPPSLVLLWGGINLMLDARFRLRAGTFGVGYLPAGGAPGALVPARDGERTGPQGLLARLRAAQADGATATAAVAGLVFGLALLVRIDGLRDVLPVVGYAGLLIALRRYQAASGGLPGFPDGRLGRPLLLGLAAGSSLGFLAAYLLARPYLAYLSSSLVPLLWICAVVLTLTALGALFGPRLVPRLAALAAPAGGGPGGPDGTAGGTAGPGRFGRLARRLPDLPVVLVVAVVAGLAARPWLQTVRRPPSTYKEQITVEFMRAVQQVNGLPIDPTRLYYENSLYWLFWYLGVPTVALAALAIAMLGRRLVRGRGFVWLLPLAIVCWTTATTLWRPSITADHPWASRRFVPIVLGGLILLACWGLRWVRDRLRRRGHGLRAQRAALAVGGLLILVPPVITSIGTAFTPVERGERAAVEALCRALPRDGSVLTVERVTADRFTALVRGTCGLPAARVRLEPGAETAAAADVRRIAAAVRAAGRTPVLLAAESGQLAEYGAPVQVMSLRTRQDERSLVDPPNGTWSFSVDVWMTVPAGG